NGWGINVIVVADIGETLVSVGFESEIIRRRDHGCIDAAAEKRRDSTIHIRPYGEPLNIARSQSILRENADRVVVRCISNLTHADAFALQIFDACDILAD